MIGEDKENKRKKFYRELKEKIKNSAILRFLFFLADFLYRRIGSSIIAYVMTGYEKCQSYYADSWFYGFFHGKTESKLKNFVQKLRKSIMVKCDESKILRSIQTSMESLLTTRLKTIGIFFLSFGFYSTVIYMLKLFALGKIERIDNSIMIGPAIIIISIFLILNKQQLYDALKRSVILRALVFEFFGLAEKSIDAPPVDALNLRRKNIIYYSFGMLFGICTYIVPPLTICIGIAGIIFLYILLCKPEIGVMAIFFGLPFLPTMLLAGFSIFVVLCYFLKLARGKRTFTFEFFDLLVLMFCIIMLFSGIISVSRTGSIKPALLYTCFAAIYFFIVNMIKSREMIVKSVICLIASGALVGLYGVYQNYFGVTLTIWQDAGMFADISGRVISTFENPNVLAEYLIMVIPFCVVSLLTAKSSKNKMIYLICTFLAVLCLIYTWSRGSWLGIIFGMAILFVIVNKNAIIVYVGVLLATPLLPFILPVSIVQRFLSIGNLSDSSTSYRVSIWIAAVKMIKNFFFSGIGVGLEAFKIVYPEFSLAGIESAPHSHSLYFQLCIESGFVGLFVLFLIIFFFLQHCFTSIIKASERSSKLFIAAGMCAILGFMLNGFTDFIWYNYRVYYMFWLVLALTVSMCRFSFKNQADDSLFYMREKAK